MHGQSLILIMIQSPGRAGPGAMLGQVLQQPWLLIWLKAPDHLQSTPSPYNQRQRLRSGCFNSIKGSCLRISKARPFKKHLPNEASRKAFHMLDEMIRRGLRGTQRETGAGLVSSVRCAGQNGIECGSGLNII